MSTSFEITARVTGFKYRRASKVVRSFEKLWPVDDWEVIGDVLWISGIGSADVSTDEVETVLLPKIEQAISKGIKDNCWISTTIKCLDEVPEYAEN